VRDCDFCDEFVGKTRNAFAKRYGSDLRDRVLMGTDRFRVIPSLGQIAEGHLLIAPTNHYRAMADMPAEDIESLEVLCCVIRSILRNTYGQCILFEHGIRGGIAGGCGIDHAHMHAVPVTAEGVLNILTREFGGTRIDSLIEIGRELGQNSSYLFLEDASRERYVFPVCNLPSQYLRKLVAESIGKTDWDWRKSGYEAELVSAVGRLLPLFSPLTTAQGR
jgi:diadenosine tetraphosphate (Ap4A) HIT family hydrolase